MNMNDYKQRATQGGTIHSMNDRPCAACGDLDGCHLPGKLHRDGLTLEDFFHAQAAWSQATFGKDSERGPAGPLKHLAKEVKEALANPTDLMEYVDLQFLVFDALRRAGFTLEQLRHGCNVKLKINQARQWPKASSDEPVEHVRDA